MNLIFQTPMEVRLALIFAVGTCLGALINLLSFRLAWQPEEKSPWSKPLAEAPPRRPTDRIPVLGWLGLRRESELHGRGFWIVPMLVEVFVGVGLAGLYWWEIGRLGLLPVDAPRNLIGADIVAMLHWPYLAHVVLGCLMLTASLIDVREKIIPDAVTVPGVWIGLGLAIVLPKSLPSELTSGLPAQIWQQITPEMFPCMNIVSPRSWPNALDGGNRLMPLLIALGCWWLWCAGLTPRVWYSRWGIAKAWKFFVGKLRRERATYWIILMGAVGSAVIGCVWYLDRANWQSLLSSLVGMAVGGGIVWVVRIIGGVVLDREAMGFGDVTLMAMIGAFLGWQACLFIFFLAPLAALAVGIVQLILFRDQEIPYGPFLCMAAAAVIVLWPAIWDYTFFLFAVGWLVPAAMAFCMLMLIILLGISRLIRGLFGW